MFAFPRFLLPLAASLLLGAACSELPQRSGKMVRDPRQTLPHYTLRTVPVLATEHPRAQALARWTDSLRLKTDFNGAILVAKGDSILFESYIGWADYQRRVPLSDTVAFQLASVSKQFTAAAILLLQQRHRLHINHKVSAYLPEFPYPEVTIRQLLTHRSGLSNYLYFCDKVLNDSTRPIDNAEVMALLAQHRPAPYYPPDQLFEYSNTGYMLLALIVERVSGQRFDQFIQTELFEPSGMERSFIFSLKHHPAESHAATGYHYRWLEALPLYLDGTWGDKSAYATPRDLLRWHRALLDGRILSPSSTAELFREQSGDPNDPYALGWRVAHDAAGNRFLWHSGWWRGFTSLLVRSESSETVLVILSNRVNTYFITHRDEVIELAFSEFVPKPKPARPLAPEPTTHDSLP